MRMKRLAVLGTGAIGCLLGGYLLKNGLDVTMLSAFRRETADYFNTHGLEVKGIHGDFHVDVRAAALDDLQENDCFDAVFLALKANDLVDAVTRLKPHLAPDSCVVTLQNGINEEFLTPILGEARVVAGISFAGGAVLGPGCVQDHDGHFVIGELSGEITPRAEALVEILKNARPAQAVTDIRAWQWQKLAAVATSVPAATISGEYLFSTFDSPKCQRLFAYIALEAQAVSAADGWPQETFGGRSQAEWRAIAGGAPAPEIERLPMPDGVVDAYTKDIRAHLPLEIDYTNGAIVRLGRRYGVPTPANELLIATIRDIEAGAATAGEALLDAVLARLAAL